MKIKSLLIILVITLSFSMQAQSLFTYAGKKTDVKEFKHAFEKVYPEGTVIDKEKSIKEYLALYINSKLKIHEAYEMGYDTLPAFKEELSNLRQQVMNNYMTDPETYNDLLDEAFTRSQKDIEVQHIFIPYMNQNNYSDSAVSKLKINEAHMELASGKKFEDVAMKYSADPSVGKNKGNIGFITAFSLPYLFENVIYNLSPGKYSEPIKSNSGYHIFKNIRERKSMGKIRVAQILISMPPGSNDESLKKHQQLADSLYNRIMKGDDFAKLAKSFSNDYVTAASGGQLPEFSVGTYEPEFENVVFALPSNGSVSKPFLTSHGYHIVKRISLTDIPEIKSKKNLDGIRPKLENDARINIARENLLKKIYKKAGFSQTEFNMANLKSFIDSTVEGKQPMQGNIISNEMILFVMSKEIKKVSDLVDYAKTNRLLPNASGVKSIDQLLQELKEMTAMDLYKKDMESYNEEFSQQMDELKDGNMFFDIMMREVWNKAQSDSTGQLNYYKKNQKKYIWKNSAEAVQFYCGDELTATELRKAIVKNPKDWKTIIDNYGDRATPDSGRFEISKISGLKKAAPKQGMITAIEKNNDDNSASFSYILKTYTAPQQKTFAEAKGDVITNYQDELDAQWVAQLKKKYPVEVDQKVLQTLLK